jgi:Fic family protein
VPTRQQLVQLEDLRKQFEVLRAGRQDLLRILDESELAETVYNSNAIENSTLTLDDTERILLAVEVSRYMDLREVHEAQNLARVTEYIRQHHNEPLDQGRLLLLHKMLLGNIDEVIAGRFRVAGEYVRVGSHVAPGPEQISGLLTDMLISFESGVSVRPTQRVAALHLEFERIHPFVDGNGRIGRVVINQCLYRLGFPPVIIRNKGKEKYYAMLRAYDQKRDTKPFEDHLVLLLLEAMHRRVSYLRGADVDVATHRAKALDIAANTILNQARRQVIPAFRERGVWKLPSDYEPK